MRKIIDSHAHAFIGKASAGLLGIPYEEIELMDRTEILLHEMDKYGAEKTCLLHAHSRRETELIQTAVRKHPTRFVGFCSWGTGVTGRGAADHIEKWLREPEFKGVGEALVKQFYLKGKIETIPEALKELRIPMDVVRAKKVPILFHTGYSGAHVGKYSGPIAWSDPLVLDEIAGEYSDVPIIIGHIGGHYPPYDLNALMMAYQHDNVYLETSKSRSDIVEKAVAEIGSSRLLFGTDWVREAAHTIGAKSERSGHLYDWNIKVIESAKISDGDKEMIFYKSAKSFLGL